jgi:PAS domain S-box-containing protein
MPDSDSANPSLCIHYAMRELLLVLDAGLCVKAASKSFYTAFKIGPDQILGKHLAELGAGQWNDPALLKVLNELPRPDGEFDDFELQYDFPKLGPRTMLVSARRLADDPSQRGMILLSILDITRQKRIEAEAGVLLNRFRTTLASIGDAVIVTDPESHITFMNPTAEKLTGWSQADAMQRHLTDVFSIINEQSSRTVENPVDKAIRDGAIVGLANHTILIARNGTEWPIDDSAAPIMDANGNIVGVVLVFHDITNRRKAEHEL